MIEARGNECVESAVEQVEQVSGLCLKVLRILQARHPRHHLSYQSHLVKFIVAKALGVKREDLILCKRDHVIPEDKIELFLNMVDQLSLQGKPIQYLTGVSHFYSLQFKVKEGATLIPRADTEIVCLSLFNVVYRVTKTLIKDSGRSIRRFKGQKTR